MGFEKWMKDIHSEEYKRAKQHSHMMPTIFMLVLSF